jgi:uncharacterized protein YacL
MLSLVRVAVVLILSASGYYFGIRTGYPLEGLAAGFGLGVLAVVIELAMRKVSLNSIVSGVLGLALGLLTAKLLLVPLGGVLVEDPSPVSFGLAALLGYGGLLLGIKKGETLTARGVFRALKGQGGDE